MPSVAFGQGGRRQMQSLSMGLPIRLVLATVYQLKSSLEDP